jgi:sugar O-acyltransferase (sialic acid O-acetyltransferase NeuD family)
VSSPVLAWGLGDQFRVMLPIMRAAGVYTSVGIDDTINARSTWKDDFPTLRNWSECQAWLRASGFSTVDFVIGVANPYGATRVALALHLEQLGHRPLQVISKLSKISASADLGSGSQIMPMAFIHEYVSTKEQVIVNTGAVVEHDCVLEAGSEIGPNATLCGRVHVDGNAWVGAGAVVLPRLTIGKNAIVGAGAVVTRSVPPGHVVAGNPARRLLDSDWDGMSRESREGDRLLAQLQ